MKDLAICCIAKDENPYLNEWIDHHLAIGVQHIFLYDNNSKESIKDFLGNQDNITVYNWPGTNRPQLPAYNNCLDNNRKEFKWIGFIDADEFIVPKSTNNLVEFLKNYEKEYIAGLSINWKVFGSNGHLTRQKSQIRSYTKCFKDKHCKVITRPEYTISFANPHFGNFIGGFWSVDENGKETRGPFNAHSSSLIQINHYVNRSLEEFKEKIQKGRADCEDIRDISQFYGIDKDCVEEDTYLKDLKLFV
jgi:hypothetical protein